MNVSEEIEKPIDIAAGDWNTLWKLCGRNPCRSMKAAARKHQTLSAFLRSLPAKTYQRHSAWSARWYIDMVAIDHGFSVVLSDGAEVFSEGEIAAIIKAARAHLLCQE